MDGWQPQSFLRLEAAYPTSTMPVRVVTDAGPAFLKVMNNPQGPHSLVREYLGTSVARWFGLPTPDFAILNLTEADEVILFSSDRATVGPAFATRAVVGTPWGGASRELESLENQEALTRLVVLDTWILNRDRHFEDPALGRTRYDNVFFGEGSEPGKQRLLVLDQSEAFSGSTCDLNARIATIDRIKDDRIYGLFPEFRPFAKMEALRRSVDRLRQFDYRSMGAVLESIPREWEIDAGARTALNELLVQRARFLADNDFVVTLIAPRIEQLPLS